VVVVVAVDMAMDVDLAVEAQTSDLTYVHALLDVCIHLFRLKFNGWSSRVGNGKLLFFILSKDVLGNCRDGCRCAML
jgi:hypothetical protein